MRIFFFIICLLIAGPSFASAAAEAGTDGKSFDLPAGLAEFTLKMFSSQSGLEVVFETKTVSGVHTHAVKGLYSPIKAIDLVLAGTPLAATQYSPDGAIIISHAPEQGAHSAASTADHPKSVPPANVTMGPATKPE